jgi:ubiquinol-cytochrome c reductase cytochrome c subunit
MSGRPGSGGHRSAWVGVLGVVAALVVASLAMAGSIAGAGERTGAGLGPDDTAPPDPDRAQLVEAGRELYLTACVSCHGVDGVGTGYGPSLHQAGEASADFYLRTGRMPLASPSIQAPQKPVAYTDQQIRELVAYVATLGDGPAIPEIDPDSADLALGGELFLANCAACHNSAGIGGALSYGQHAPSLWSVEPTQIAEAVRIGPGQMPVFGPETITDAELDAIVRYVQYLQNPEKPGGLQLGGAGPVPEGFVAWVVGIGVLVLFIRWITRRHA